MSNLLLVVGGAAWHLLQRNRENPIMLNGGFPAYLFLFVSIFALVASIIMFLYFVCRGNKDV